MGDDAQQFTWRGNPVLIENEGLGSGKPEYLCPRCKKVNDEMGFLEHVEGLQWKCPTCNEKFFEYFPPPPVQIVGGLP